MNNELLAAACIACVLMLLLTAHILNQIKRELKAHIEKIEEMHEKQAKQLHSVAWGAFIDSIEKTFLPKVRLMIEQKPSEIFATCHRCNNVKLREAGSKELDTQPVIPEPRKALDTGSAEFAELQRRLEAYY